MEVTRVGAQVPYRVRFDEAGADGRLRLSVLLRYAQDVAWIHSETLGFDRAWYAARGLAWLVRSAELELLDAIGVGESLLVRTEVTGFRKVWARRRTEVRRQPSADLPGPLVAWLHTDWVMIDARGAPARVPPEIPRVFAPAEPFTPIRVALPDAPDTAARLALAVRPHELDPMAHANNGVYLDWALEAAAAVVPEDPVAVRRARLEYVAPAGRGDRLEVRAWPLGDPARAGADDVAAPAVGVRIDRLDGGEVLRAVLSR